MIQLMWSNLQILASFTGGRDLQKKASAYSRSCTCQNQYKWLPLPSPRCQEADCHQGTDASGPGPCIGPATVTAPKPRTRKPARGSIKKGALLQHVPEPASYQPSITAQLLHVLGKAARLPAKSHKLPKPKPAESHAFYRLAGTKKAKAALKAPLDTLPGTPGLCRPP